MTGGTENGTSTASRIAVSATFVWNVVEYAPLQRATSPAGRAWRGVRPGPRAGIQHSESGHGRVWMRAALQQEGFT